jgi:phosphopantetheinyl transferase
MCVAVLETIEHSGQPKVPEGTDVWIVSIQDTDAVSVGMLAREEDRKRHAQILPPRRKRQFVFRRAVLDYVLRHYVPDYTIEHDANGKPHVRAAEGAAPVYFSASSSQHLCAVGVSRQQIGIDLEARSQQVDLVGICEKYVPAFSGMGPLWQNSRVARQLAMCAWCRTESTIKLHGLTLHAVLFQSQREGAAPLEPGPHADIVISGNDFVCVVSQAERIGLNNIYHLGFEQICHEHQQEIY